MTDLRKAAQMALDWRDKNGELLFALGGWDFIFEINDWSQSLRGALAQPEPEPVAWMHIMDNTEGIEDNGTGIVSITQKRKHPFGKPGIDFSKSYPVTSTPLYTAQPQREWQGLTDEDYEAMAEKYVTNCYFDTLKYARAIEAKLKEKNT